MLTPVLPENYIGHLLYLEPKEATDWKLTDDSEHGIDSTPPETVIGFHLRVRYFLTLWKADTWCGLVGTAEQAGHPFDNFWVGCSVNYSGYADFTDHLRVSWCRVGPNRPQESGYLCPSGFPIYAGAGVVAESKAAILEALKAKRIFGSFYC